MHGAEAARPHAPMRCRCQTLVAPAPAAAADCRVRRHTRSEKDLDEVLQSTSVFHNVSKGVAAKDKDLQASVGISGARVVITKPKR